MITVEELRNLSENTIKANEQAKAREIEKMVASLLEGARNNAKVGLFFYTRQISHAYMSDVVQFLKNKRLDAHYDRQSEEITIRWERRSEQ